MATAKFMKARHQLPGVRAKLYSPEAKAKRLEKAPKFSRTRPELAVEQLLQKLELNFVAQFVHPDCSFHTWDFALPDERILIEVDGCYWHGCKQCDEPGLPDVRRNDRTKTTWAKKLGWRLLRIKEHATRAYTQART